MEESHYPQAYSDVQALKERINNRNIIRIDPMYSDVCLESYPCKGHGGVRVQLDDEEFNYPCSSVSIACIQKALTGDVHPHFQPYAAHYNVNQVYS